MNNRVDLLVFVVILLVVSLPVVAAHQLNTYTKSVTTPLFQTGDRLERFQEVLDRTRTVLNGVQGGTSQMNFTYGLENNPAEQCEERGKKADEKLAFMDSGVIKALEGILNIARAICLTLGAIDNILSTLGELIGFIGGDGSSCCAIGLLSFGTACEAQWGIYQGWQNVYSHIKPICCWATCGWCTTGCYGLKGIFKDFGKEPFQPTGKSYGIYGAGKQGNLKDKDKGMLDIGGISSIGLSPYDNIYTAMACFCPGAILTNLRKLKSIYQVYDCCVEEACSQGMSTEGCESMLDESTCMFWEGALISSLAKIIFRMIIAAIFKYVVLTETQALWMKCILSIFELIQTPQNIQGIIAEWQRAMKSFSDPSCEDLGFSNIRDDFSQVNDDLRNQIPLNYEDFDGDGYADGPAEKSRGYGYPNAPISQTGAYTEEEKEAILRAWREEERKKQLSGGGK